MSRYRFRTYLDDVFQEEGGGTDDIGGSNVPSSVNYHSFPTRKPFDAVEIAITRSGSADVDAFRIHEVCAE